MNPRHVKPILALLRVLGVGFVVAVVQGSVAYAQSTPTSPHFKCYVITPKPAASETITLTDQFGTDTFLRQGPEFVCTPVLTKNGAALTQPEPPFDHLKCHNIVPSGPPVNQTVTVTDQFGTETVTVRTAQFLCAPATKTVGAPGA